MRNFREWRLDEHLRIHLPRTRVSRGKSRGRDPVGYPSLSCSCGALLLTSRLLALPLAFLPLLLPDLLALLAVFRVSLPILLQILRHPLALQLLESGLPLSLVGSPVQAILLPVRFVVRVACSPPQLYPTGAPM